MMTLDAQVHAYEKNRPGRPWQEAMPGLAEATGAEVIAAMDAVDVAGAILVSPYKCYRFDASYARDVYFQYPTRFSLVKPVDPHAPDIEDIISEWKGTPGAVGIRILFCDGVSLDPADPATNRVLNLAARHGLPVNLFCWGDLELVPGLAQRNPDTRLIIDHLGLVQPFAPPVPPDPWADLPKLLELAQYPNVAVKVSGACTLSPEPFPYADIWEPLGRIFDTFGFDRLMWGSDWTRCADLLAYEPAVESFRIADGLSQGDREALMGGTLQRIYGWSPG